jgi:hypothetical protein
VYQLLTGLLKVRVASRGQFLGIIFVSHVARVATESVKDHKVIRSDKDKDLPAVTYPGIFFGAG